MIKNKLKSPNTLLFVLLAFVIWQLILIVISPVSSKVFPARDRFMYNDGFKKLNPVFFWNRANFDGAHYLLIAENGYGVYQQAFFPFYPKLIRFFTPIFGNKNLLASLFISNFSFLIALFMFYKLIRLDYTDKVARSSIFFLIIFPTSFFYGMAYTEGIFFLFLIGSFYFARKGNMVIAGILGGFASYTRLVGVFIFPALLIEWFEQVKGKPFQEKLRKFLPLLFVLLGLFIYMRYLLVYYNDPLKFMHVQQFFGAERTSGKLILLYQVFFRYIKMIATSSWDPLYLTVWLELFSATGFIVILILSFIKRIRLSYLVFSLFSFLAPTLTGTFSSLPRYVLILFPCFIFLGLIKNKIIKFSLSFVFVMLFLISIMFFYQGYWIS